MKRLLCAGIAVVLTLLVSAGPASAATSAPPATAPAAITSSGLSTSPMQQLFYQKWATYGSYFECDSDGSFGQAIGNWVAYYCIDNGFLGVDLYVAFTPDPPPPVPAQTVQIQNAGSGKCVDVQWRNSANGTPIQLWGCSPNNPAQTWTIYSDGTIRALGKCLDIKSGSKSAGARIHLWDCVGVNSQKWESISVDGNTRMLRNPISGRCLDAINGGSADGTLLQLYDCVTTTSAQRWTFIPPLT